MKRKVLCTTLCLMIIFLNLTSSFVFADNDFIQTEPAEIYSPDTEMSLLENELETEFNEEYYNEDHLVEEEKEPEDNFDTKTELHTVENPDSSNSSNSTNDSTSMRSSDWSDSTNNDDIQSYSLRSEAVEQSEDYGIMPLSENYLVFPDGWSGDFSSWSYYRNQYVTMSVDDCFNYTCQYINDNFSDYDYDKSILQKENFTLFHADRTIEESLTIADGFDRVQSCYYYIFSLDDSLYLTYDTYFNNILSSNYICGMITFSGKTSYHLCISVSVIVINGDFKIFSSGAGHFNMSPDSDPTLLYSSKPVYINEERQFEVDDDGFIKGDIKGDFSFSDKSKILTYKAWSDKKLDKTYDVHLFALDNPTVPATLTGAEDFPIVDLESYQENKLQLSPDKSSVQASYELEAVYYYLHQMKGYDDSLESVDGYNFTEFESRENLNFAIAYREKNNVGYWTVCKSYQYNYQDLIDNVIGEFTIKKDYVEFPDIHDYIEEFPSFDDYLSEVGGDDPGILDYMIAGFKWTGDCIVTLGHNIIGFFKWLFACIPVLWENLGIALYNLVCDIKSLALYFFNPKTKSIYAMACDRIPSLASLSDAIQNPNSISTPSLTFFGFKLSLNFSDYFDVSYAKSIFSLLYVVIFAFGVFKLLLRVFSFD